MPDSMQTHMMSFFSTSFTGYNMINYHSRTQYLFFDTWDIKIRHINNTILLIEMKSVSLNNIILTFVGINIIINAINIWTAAYQL